MPLHQCLDLDYHDTSEFFVHGKGPNVLVAMGCSWTRAWNHNDDVAKLHLKFDDDREFMWHKSYAGQVRGYLGHDGMINLAIPGSSNDCQVRLLMDLLQKHRSDFGQVFVLWGITSHCRWELWSNVIDRPSGFQIGSRLENGKAEEMKFFLTRHWNDHFELQRLSHKITMLHCYLKQISVDHLFFPAFESMSTHNMDLANIDDSCYFKRHSHKNDMMSLWCQEHGISDIGRVMSNPHNRQDVDLCRPLIELGYLGRNFAHPTELAHQDIADKLIHHLQNTRKLQ